jgi:hypothetical protein
MTDGQRPCAEEVSDGFAEAYRLARIVEQMPAPALLMAMLTLHAPARAYDKSALNGHSHE